MYEILLTTFRITFWFK